MSKSNKSKKKPTPEDKDLSNLTSEELKAEVIRLRDGIRHYRDQTGHELCWFNPELTGLLPEQQEQKPFVPPFCEFMQNCAAFRQSLESVESTKETEWKVCFTKGLGDGKSVEVYTRQVLGLHQYRVIHTGDKVILELASGYTKEITFKIS